MGRKRVTRERVKEMERNCVCSLCVERERERERVIEREGERKKCEIVMNKV